MGKKPDQIERDIRERRERISYKLSNLQDRLGEDLDVALNAVSEETSSIMQRFERNLRLDERMQESPLMVLGGGLGLGVLLGAASSSIGFGGNGQGNGRRNGSSGGGRLDGALAGITGMASGIVGEELRQFLRASLYGADGQPRQDGRAQQQTEQAREAAQQADEAREEAQQQVNRMAA